MESNLKTEKVLENGHAKNFDFAEKVEQSKKVIQDQVTEKLAKQEKKKSVRGGARPGAGRKRLETTERRPSDQTTQGPTELPSGQSIAPPPDISIYLTQPLIAVSKIPAVKHGIPELALSQEEALACAQSLNAVLGAFVPDTATMDPKTASVIGCLVTMGSIGFQKYVIFNEKKKPVEKVDDVQESVAAEQEISGQTSETYFKRNIV